MRTKSEEYGYVPAVQGRVSMAKGLRCLRARAPMPTKPDLLMRHWPRGRAIALILCCLGMGFAIPEASAQPFFGNGTKVGEVSADSAILWVRLTKSPSPDFDRMPPLAERVEEAELAKQRMPTAILPGRGGEVRIAWWPEDRPTEVRQTSWLSVDAARDHTLHHVLRPLEPATRYVYEIDARDAREPTATRAIGGRFLTPPQADEDQPVRFIVTTCQTISRIDSGADGHVAYHWMKSLEPDFFVHTGDIVYYDKEPFAKTIAEARAKWNLMFGYGYIRAFLGSVSAYFMKDDHDTLKNDCWPGQRYGDLTFAQGQALFREQVPMTPLPYRTYRWGKHLQIWLTENRDYRSPNTDPDGPGKTILGKEQMAWLRKTVRESDARFKIIISPDPIVGPDKPGKNDNHANEGFQTEGQLLRDYLSGVENTYVICGDRHWQYASKDPKTGLIEWGCGPINDEHDFGGNPGYSPEAHLYFNKGGGFLMVEVNAQKAVAKWFAAPASIDHEGSPPLRCRLEFPYLPPSNETVP